METKATYITEDDAILVPLDISQRTGHELLVSWMDYQRTLDGKGAVYPDTFSSRESGSGPDSRIFRFVEDEMDRWRKANGIMMRVAEFSRSRLGEYSGLYRVWDTEVERRVFMTALAGAQMTYDDWLMGQWESLQGWLEKKASMRVWI